MDKWENAAWRVVWLVVYALAAASLTVATRTTFARFVGRVEDNARPLRRPPPRRPSSRVA
jgi:hypothetical protein